MKALRLVAAGTAELMDMPIPEIGDGDILIRVKAAGICGGDVHFYKGEMLPPFYPMVFGHEFAGVIERVGPRVTQWSVGDRVVSENTGYACGKCACCIRGEFVLCRQRETIGCSVDGGFAEYVKIPEQILNLHPNCLFPIPENMSFAEATVLEPTSNAYKSVVQESGCRPGETIAIAGPGALGLLGVQAARILGAAKIIVLGTERSRQMREPLARQFGATHWLSTDADGYVEVAQEIAGTDGVAAFIDYVGAPKLLQAAMEIVRNGGTIVRVGRNVEPVQFSLQPLTDRSIRLLGHMGYNTESWRACFALHQAGLLDLKSMSSAVWPLREYRQAFQSIQDKKSVKVILEP